MGLRREAAAHETQQIDLGIAHKDKTRVEKAVHPGSFIWSSTVQWVAILAEARHGAHDAVRFEDADLAVRAEGGGDGAERMRLQKSRGLVQ